MLQDVRHSELAMIAHWKLLHTFSKRYIVPRFMSSQMSEIAISVSTTVCFQGRTPRKRDTSSIRGRRYCAVHISTPFWAELCAYRRKMQSRSKFKGLGPRECSHAQAILSWDRWLQIERIGACSWHDDQYTNWNSYVHPRMFSDLLVVCRCLTISHVSNSLCLILGRMLFFVLL